MIPGNPFAITDEMRSSFEHFVKDSFHEIFRPEFTSDEDRDSAIRIWWRVTQEKRHCIAKIQDFRVALHRLLD